MDWKSFLEFSDDSIDDVRLVGYSYIKQGCYDIAIDFFNALIVLNPENIYDLQTLGALYLEKGRYIDALEFLDKALKINPQNDFAMLNRVKSLFSLGYRREALSSANELIKRPNRTVASQANALIKAYS